MRERCGFLKRIGPTVAAKAVAVPSAARDARDDMSGACSERGHDHESAEQA